ncbi:SDR family oxidoreductase [Aquabacter spiritensis]|uniref:Short-subunit dehydrogenase n=1 Tax=Aquabacter spiritensis TaxID=933073 RepID=A0A4R3LZM1_9HYPH|nr:SDR family oxidoreductase [Aquabacter spiritensis]TCT04227.1 short-subunit dehydrogenase [Aquabacter spiritensis]
MDLGLSGKAAVITGGSRGLGAAIAGVLAREGMNLVLMARDGAALATTAATLAQAHGVAVTPVSADLSAADAVARAADAAVSALGGVDVLVNSAGATKRGNFFSLTEADWESGYDLKFFSAVRMSRALWPSLKARQGAIVNIVGIGGRMPAADFTIGGSVNAALLNFTKALAEVGTQDGVRVNAVNPGFFRTDRLAHSLRSLREQTGCSAEEAEATLLARLGVRRFGEAREVGDLIAFMISRHADYLNGAAIELDGGTRRGI